MNRSMVSMFELELIQMLVRLENEAAGTYRLHVKVPKRFSHRKK